MLNKDNKKMAKITTQITSLLAHGICKVWAWGRSFRDENNFDYFIREVRPSPTKLPYIKKLVHEDDKERSVTLKIGSIVIEYSFGKTPEEKVDSNVCELFKTKYDARDEVITALVSITRQTHHNNSVLSFSKNKKENDGSKYRQSSS